MAFTPKQLCKQINPELRLDYYETLRNDHKPCWFIRNGLQGRPLTVICASPTMAWREAADILIVRSAYAAKLVMEVA